MKKIAGRTFLYVLKDPVSGLVRYVGKADDPDDRYRRHCRLVEKSPKGQWINDLRTRGLVPVLEVVAEVVRAEGHYHEMAYVAQLNGNGALLLNSNDSVGKITGATNKDPLVRFWSKVDKNGPIRPGMTTKCWVWKGKKGERKHGHFGCQDEAGNWHTVQAHRWLWKQERGPLDDALVLDHLCENPSCVNLDHLEPKSLTANTMRGNSPHAANARKTHCPRGHEYTPDNIYLVNNARICRTCSIDAAKARSAKHLADPENREAHNAARREKRNAHRLLNPLVPKPPRTTCRRGHAWTPENEEWYQNGRHCKQCRQYRAQLAQSKRVRKPHHKSIVTHCPRGHAYDELNTYLGSRGDRQCRACAREKAVEKRKSLQAAA